MVDESLPIGMQIFGNVEVQLILSPIEAECERRVRDAVLRLGRDPGEEWQVWEAMEEVRAA